MINFNKAYATVFSPKKNDRGVALATLSTGKKTKEGKWINSKWNNVSFVGDKCKEKFDTLKEKDRMCILSGRIERVKAFNSEGEEIKDAKGFPTYYLNISVFDFVMADEMKENDGEDEALPI